MENLQAELIAIKNEIRDLKTAQTMPGYSTMYSASATLPAGTYAGTYTWTITYDDVGSTDAPITTASYGTGFSLLPFNPTYNTQKLEMSIESLTTTQNTIPIYSTRPIASVGGIVKTDNPDPYTPSSTWVQVRAFNIANMGTNPGWCLQNCRLGFGISSGTFATARADMQSQLANGTLHDAKGYPPNYIQVPVYIDTGIPEGHVVVWDKGTVYSDGVLISGGLSYYGLNNIWGWGELCDGARVVQKT